MEGFLLDPTEPSDTTRPAARVPALRERVLREAQERARRFGLRLVVEPPWRAADLATLWFQGERAQVLGAVGEWEPEAGVAFQIAHARLCSGHYELVLIAAVADASPRRAA